MRVFQFLSALFSLVFLSCDRVPNIIFPSEELNAVKLYKESNLETYRPRFHFTPAINWMNDPNGLVYYNDYYHYFFQHNPKSTVWGPMHWGHARSKDLIHWERLPVALYPDENGWIFSGSVVVDKNNTSGFGKNTLVAIFTYHNAEIEKSGSDLFQTQGIAYSKDNGETWIKYGENPVLKNPGIRDFRDPKVFWNEKERHWNMSLAAKDKILFYQSADLKNWKLTGEYTDELSETLGVWECPDLFELTVKGTNDKKWVLIISHGQGAINKGSGTRYIIGDFDGLSFKPTNESKWLDFGKDNYAGVTFNNHPENKRVLMGWMSNWDYATSTPSKNWRSSATIPRELVLHRIDTEYVLASKPISNFELLKDKQVTFKNSNSHSIQFTESSVQHRISMVLDSSSFTEIKLNNELEEYVTYIFDGTKHQILFNRTSSGNNDFNNSFNYPQDHTIEWNEVMGSSETKVEILVDASSLELFVNDGLSVSTNQIFSSAPLNNLRLESSETIQELRIESLNSIWK